MIVDRITIWKKFMIEVRDSPRPRMMWIKQMPTISEAELSKKQERYCK
jgi:hypothetical protein